MAVALLSLAGLRCESAGAIPALRLDPKNLTGEVMIRNWTMIGPFPVGEGNLATAGYSNGAAGLDREYLTAFGVHDDSAEPDQFRAMVKQLRGPIRAVGVLSESELIEPTNFFDFDTYGVVYAAAEIVSASEAVLALQCSNTHGLKVWLNQANILTTGYSTGAQKLQHVLRVRLRRGTNFLLLKKTVIKDTPVGYGFPAGFSVGFSSIQFARGMLRLVCQEMISDSMNGYWPYGRNILGAADQLRISLPLYADEPAQIEIANARGQAVYSHSEKPFRGTWARPVNDLAEGLYRISLRFSAEQFEDTFYVGDLDRAFSRLKSRSGRFLSDETAGVNLAALLTRFETLIDFRKGGEVSMFQDPNIVYLISELETILADLENSKEAFKGRPGTHIRGFRSKIDRQIRHYMVHSPVGSEDAPRPLVIIVPFTNERHPFLRSITVAQRQYATMTARLADEAGYRVLWPDARGVMETASPIAVADVLEALEAVKKDYRVDEDRIYLAGFCSGGRGALLLAERFPSLFAAVATWGPNRSRADNSLERRWFDVNQPYALLENLFNVPVYVLQGKYDNDPPVREAREFVEDAGALGVKVEYREVDGAHVYFALHPLPEFFRFFRGKSRQTAPAEARLATGQLKYNEAQWIRITGLREPMAAGTVRARVQADGSIHVATDNVTSYELLRRRLPIDKNRQPAVRSDGRVVAPTVTDEAIVVGARGGSLLKSSALEGPISDVFSDRFLVVFGSRGSLRERQEIAALVGRFQATWTELFHCDMTVKPDSEVTETDILRSHLILLGGAETNSVTARIFPRIPVRVDVKSLVIGERVYRGEIGFQLVYPNPLNPAKYVAVLAGTGIANYRLQNERMVLNGWYDFVVWRCLAGEKAEIVDIGYFDSEWRHVVSCVRPGMESALGWPWIAEKSKDLGLARF